MKKNRTILLSLCLLVIGNNVFAQAKPYTISGKVTSFEESLALEGVNVYVKGTKNSTGTQPDGSFSLEITPENKTLVFELKEYENQEVNINGKKQYDIVLKRAGQNAKANLRSSAPSLAFNKISISRLRTYWFDIVED